MARGDPWLGLNDSGQDSTVADRLQSWPGGGGAEMGRLLKMFRDRGWLWLVGTATCTIHLRCQVYHLTMENDWDLQAVPIAPLRSLMSPR